MKKGLIDTMYVPFAVFFLIIAICVTAFVYFSISEALSADIPFFASAETAETMSNVFIALIYAVYFGLPIVAIILAFLNKSHPVFIVVAISFLLVSVLLSAVAKFILVKIIETFPYVPALFESGITSLLIEYYPFIMFVFAILIIIAQFVRE